MITLLTDFGDRDVYVGVMKGVIARIAPQSVTIDLTHQIPPQNLWAARFALMSAVPYFPEDTVHVAVVDPGVGSSRRGIAVEFASGLVVCPDNGICSGIVASEEAIAAVELTNTQYWRVPNPSKTFHGRDIFAAVGAHLANGVPLAKLGRAIAVSSLVKLDLPEVETKGQQIAGCIQYIDRFGNLVTNISAESVAGRGWRVTTEGMAIASGKTYSDVAVGQAASLIGSHGWVEIAVNGGSAETELNLTWQDKIQIIVDI